MDTYKQIICRDIYHIVYTPLTYKMINDIIDDLQNTLNIDVQSNIHCEGGLDFDNGKKQYRMKCKIVDIKKKINDTPYVKNKIKKMFYNGEYKFMRFPIIDEDNKNKTDIAVPKNTLIRVEIKAYVNFNKKEIDTIKDVFEKYDIQTYIYKRLYKKLTL